MTSRIKKEIASKNPHAQALVALRWAKVSKKERIEYAKKLVAAREAKRKLR